MISENIIPLNAKERQGETVSTRVREEHGSVIRECRKLVNVHLEKLIKSMFHNVDDFLFDLAEKAAANPKQQTNYFDAMRLIRVRRDEIEKNYMYRIDAQINLGLTGLMVHSSENQTKHAASTAESSLTLGLVDKTDLEESLAITNMTTKLSSQVNRELFALAQRFNFILSTQTFSAEEQPLSVSMFCNAFKDALSALGSDATIEIKLIIYKLFERFVLAGFAQLYFDINNIFIHAGILPTIKNNISKSQQTLRSKVAKVDDLLGDTVGASPVQDMSMGHLAAGYPSHVHSGAYQHLRQLLAHSYYASEGLDDAVAMPDVAETSRVIGMLTSLQQMTDVVTANSGSVQSAAQLKERLNNALGEAQDLSVSSSLHRDYRDTIDIIAMIFEFILDDDNLHPTMKALLARLQIPVLKVAMLDKEFFSRNTHPARRLLNEMAHACVGWSGGDDLTNDVLYQGVSTIVQRVLTEFNDDAALFAELLDSFQKINEQRTEQEHKVEDTIVALKQKVIDTIEASCCDVDVPSEIRQFVTNHWANVLQQTCIKHGETSAAWKSAVETMNNLLWSVQPKFDDTERRLLLVMIPQLIENIDAGLKFAQVDERVKKNFILMLEKYHIKSVRPTSRVISAKEHAVTSAPEAADEIVLESLAEAGEELTEQLALVTSLALGTWVEFVQSNGTASRGKLVWKDDYFDSYTFVSRRYKVVADDTKAGIAKLFARGRARVLEHIPLLDRALDAITEKLAKMSAAKNTED